MTLTPFLALLRKISSLILVILSLACLVAAMSGCAGPRIMTRVELGKGKAGFEGEDYVITYSLKRGGKTSAYLKLTLDLDLFEGEQRNVERILLARLTRKAHFLAEVLDSRIEELQKKELEGLLENLSASLPECKIRIIDSSYKVVAASEKKEVGKKLYGRKAFPKRPEDIFEKAPDFLSKIETRKDKRALVLTHFLNDAQDRLLGFLEITFPVGDHFTVLEEMKKGFDLQMREFAWTLALSLNSSLASLDFRSDIFRIQNILENLSWEMEGVKELALINQERKIVASTNLSKVGKKLPSLDLSPKILEGEVPKRRDRGTALSLPELFQRDLKLKARVFSRAVNDTYQISQRLKRLLEDERGEEKTSRGETPGLSLLEEALRELGEYADSIKAGIDLQKLINNWGEYPAVADIEVISPDSTVILSTNRARIGSVLKGEISLGAYLEDDCLVCHFPLLENGEPIAFTRIGLRLEEYRFVPVEEKENILNYSKLSASLLNTILRFNISNRMKIEGMLDLEAMAREMAKKTGNSIKVTFKEGEITVAYIEPEKEDIPPGEEFELLYPDDYLEERSKREREAREKEMVSVALQSLRESSLAHKEKMKELLEISRLVEEIVKVKGVEKMRLLDSSYRVINSSLENEIGQRVGRGSYSRRWGEEEVKIDLEEFANLRVKFLAIASPLKEGETLRGIVELTLTYPFQR